MSDTFAVAKCPKLRKIPEQNSLKQNLPEQKSLEQKLFGQNPLEQGMLKYLRKFLGYPLGEMIDYPPPWVVLLLLLKNGLDELVIRDVLYYFIIILQR